ncbi:ead/Ea22-like family protein [Salmonella enterica subsp. enterica serovar Bredeney]|nr:ead/Ea22-like family protein [Salmonella enterica subsp. enterica serovar Bredeney]
MNIDKQALREVAERAKDSFIPNFRAPTRDVLALLDENIQLQREKDAIEAVALALRDDMRDAREKLEAAERRIAELEAKLETADKLQDSAFRDGLKAGFSYGQTDDQFGYEQCLKSYSSRGKDNG